MKLQKRLEEKRSQVIDLYKQGVSISKIVDTLAVTKASVRKILLLEKIEIRSQSTQQLFNNGSSSLKHDAFDVLTEEALYWIGFLYADGYVIKKNNRHLISIDLATKDKSHLEKFKTFLSAGVSIRDSKRKKRDSVYYTSIITISSKPLFDRLTQLGFTNNKTYDATVHPDLISYSAFWRGVFDGDGWVSNTHTRDYKYPWVGLCGTINTVQSFIDFVKKTIPTTVIQARHKKNTKNNYETAFVNEVGKKVLHLLYKDSTVYLDRKYQKYLEFIETE
jgi:DNA-binding transcriptional regulator WhiA